jgi:hypothetical protein
MDFSEEEKAEIERKLLQGLDELDRGESREMTAEDWEQLRKEIRTTSEKKPNP